MIMKKNDLIKLLSEIEGNPEIKIWNGFVSDLVNVSSNISHDYVRKYKLDWYINTIQNERRHDLHDRNHTLSEEDIKEITKEWKNMPYEYSEYSFEGEDNVYNKKKVIVISPKTMNKSAFDRFGSIEY